MIDTARVAAWMAEFASQVHAHAAELTELDRQIGDADHGANMDRGMKAVVAVASAEYPDAAAYLKKAGMTLVSTVGGASGPLYGTLLLRIAASLPTGAPIGVAEWGVALRAGLDGVRARGKAEVGDKTLVDALAPAVDAFDAASAKGLRAALDASAAAAATGRDATIPLVARKGRASYLGDRSAGHQDPGATSLTLLLDAAARTLA